ncbi:MAG: PASTA domain-containing protein, partial [Lachnospiraceae bacterium]|nr:PASTA domain-containing protein [Lachnospiraceae bacterium]
LQHINDEITSPKEEVPDIPISVEKIVLKCTQKKPDRRYLKMSDLIADLKKSLVTPDEDFVQIAPASVSSASTVMMTDEEVNKIRNNEIGVSEDDDEMESDETEENEDDEDDIFGEDDDIDAENPKMDKVIFIGAIVSGVLFVILAIVLFMKSMGGCGGSGEEEQTTMESESLKSTQTKVPSVIGKSEDEAIDLLKAASIGTSVEYEYSSTIPKGDVIRLSVDEGTVVDKNSKITIFVSQGAKKGTMPDVVGKDKDEAKKLLESDEYGLVVTFEYQMNEEVEANKVISTNPEAKKDVYFGDTVTVYISQGSDTSDVVMPDITDVSKEKAKATLEGLGLSMNIVDEKYDKSVAAGNIISQGYKEGKVIPRGTVVDVAVSKGPEPTTKAPETTTKAPETNTQETTTKKTTFSASFPSVSADKFGVEAGVTGTITSAVLTYTNSDGNKATETLNMNNYSIYTEFSDQWSQGTITISKSNVKEGSEATITFTLSYPALDENGVSVTKEATATTTAVFN